MVTKVLLAADDGEAAVRLRHALEAEQMTVLRARSAEEVLALLDSHALDMMILQSDLPGAPGHELARICRQRTGALVLLVDMGAAEALMREEPSEQPPTGIREVETEVAKRVGALRMLDVPGNDNGFPPHGRASHCLTSGDLTLFLERHAAMIGDHYIRLTPVEAQILRVLIEHSPRVVPPEMLIERVWPDGDGDLSALAAGITSLRRAMGDEPLSTSRLTHVEGYGFRLTPPAQ